MKDAALIPLRLFRSSTFSVTMVGGFIVGVAMFGAITMVPQYFQVVRGYSPTMSGLMMLPLVLASRSVAARRGVHQIHWALQVPARLLGTFVVAIRLGAVRAGALRQPAVAAAGLRRRHRPRTRLAACRTLIIAAQNAGPRSDMGVSTAAATFFRQMGGTLGVAVFLTILFNLLPNKIIDAFGGQLPPGFRRHAAERYAEQYQRDRRALGRGEDTILIGFTNSMHGVFFAAAGVALVSCVVLMFMKEIPLQDEPAPTLEPITLRRASPPSRSGIRPRSGRVPRRCSPSRNRCSLLRSADIFGRS